MNQLLKCLSLGMILIFSSCKSTKNTTDDNTISHLSSKKILKKHLQNQFDSNTLSAKLKIKYADEKQSQQVQVKLRIERDQKIWMSASFLGFQIAKVYITPDKVQYYEKIGQTYFEGDFSLVSKWLGTDMNFQNVQNLLLGQLLDHQEDEKYKSQIDENSYKLIPKDQEALYNIFYWLDPNSFKIKQQEISQSNINQSLKVAYPEYQNIEKEILPKVLDIKVTTVTSNKSIQIEYRNIELNKTLKFPFSIPKGYNLIEIN